MIIGLTGSFGTGKTTVAKMLRSMGAKVIDADNIAHAVIRKGTPSYKKIVARFGMKILNDRGEIGRRSLARQAFKDRESINFLNRVVHPAVVIEVKRKIRRCRKDDIVVIDAPLLIETRLHRIADKLIVVKTPRDLQIRRCSRKFGMNKSEVTARINSQMSLRKKIRFADYIVDNSGALLATSKQAEKIWRKIAWK